MSWLTTFDPNPRWMIITLHVITTIATVIFIVGISCLFLVKVAKSARFYRNMLCANLCLDSTDFLEATFPLLIMRTKFAYLQRNYMAQLVISWGTIPVIHLVLGGGYPVGFLRSWGMSSCAQLSLGVFSIAASACSTVLLFLYRHQVLVPYTRRTVALLVLLILSLSVFSPGPSVTFLCLTVNLTESKDNPNLTLEVPDFWEDHAVFLYLHELNVLTLVVGYIVILVVVMFGAIFAMVICITVLMQSKMISDVSRRLHRQFTRSLVAQTLVQYILFLVPGIFLGIALLFGLPLQGLVQITVVSYSLSDPAGVLALIYWHKDYKAAVRKCFARVYNFAAPPAYRISEVFKEKTTPVVSDVTFT